MIKHKFFINLDRDTSRAEKFKYTDYIRWRATSREEVSDELNKKMISMYNYPEKAHLGRCGCFNSHITLLEHIVANKLDDVLIVEDDAIEVNEIPTDYPKGSLVYLGGFLHNKKMMNNSKVIIESINGINHLPAEYRIIMTLSYIVPTWVLAEDILKQIKSLKRYRAIDILYGSIDIKRAYQFPACFIEEGAESTIQKKTKRSNESYEWVRF